MPSTDTIDFPKGYTAYLFGVSLTPPISCKGANGGPCYIPTGWKQEVKVKVQNTDGDDEVECTAQGTTAPLVVTEGGSGLMNQEAIVFAADNDNDRQIELDFKVFKNGAATASNASDYKKYTNAPVTWVTNYTYTTEDGGDSDFHDTTLVVSLVKNSK